MDLTQPLQRRGVINEVPPSEGFREVSNCKLNIYPTNDKSINKLTQCEAKP